MKTNVWVRRHAKRITYTAAMLSLVAPCRGLAQTETPTGVGMVVIERGSTPSPYAIGKTLRVKPIPEVTGTERANRPPNPNALTVTSVPRPVDEVRRVPPPTQDLADRTR